MVRTIQQENNHKRMEFYVLFAEDNEINRMVLESLLHEYGCDVIAVANGQEAMRFARHNRFDLIILDIQMPVVDGYEAASEISKWMPEVPIIAISASMFDEDREKAKSVGIHNYLPKPASREQLFDLLDFYLKEKPRDTVSLQ